MRATEGPAPLPAGTGPETSAPTKRLRLADQGNGTGDTPELLPRLLPWEAHVLAEFEGHDVPLYASPEWHALPKFSPLRMASAVRFAAAQRTWWEERQRLHQLELDALRAEDERAEWPPHIVAQVHAVAQRLLQRPEPIDGRPRDGDHPGGPVPWDRDHRGLAA